TAGDASNGSGVCGVWASPGAAAAAMIPTATVATSFTRFTPGQFADRRQVPCRCSISGRMSDMLRRVSVCLGLLVGLIVSAASSSPQAAAAPACPAPPARMTFAAPKYLDTGRAGGEPMVATHPDGTLLIGTHAGTTHFFTPAAVNPTSTAFAQHYTGQTYDYWSNDLGRTWHFVPRSNIPDNVMGSGFSDPDFAI